MMRREWLLSFRLVDMATLVYLSGIGLLLVVFHQELTQWPAFVLAHFLVAGAIILLIRFAEKSQRPILLFLRDWYPVLLYSVLFEEIGGIATVIFPFWLEPYLLRADLALFGVHPSEYFNHIATPTLNELMGFSYWTYYLMIPLVGLFFYRKAPRVVFHRYLFRVSFALYICYGWFVLMPARGPHETLPQFHVQSMTGGFFYGLVRLIQKFGSISGGAFPSSHVAAAWTVLLVSFGHARVLAYILLLCVAILSVAIVYMGYHYAVDSLAGIGAALIFYFLSGKIEAWWDSRVHRNLGTHLPTAALGVSL